MRVYTLGFLLAVSCSCGIAGTYDFVFVKPPTAAIAPFGVQLGCAAISNSGEAVGNFIGSDHLSHGLLVKADGTAMVIDAPNLPQTALAGVNSGGWIVGSNNNFSQGFLLAPDQKTFTPLAIPAGSPNGRYSPMSINDSGDIVGILAGADGTYHGWLLSGGSLTVFDYPGANGTQVTGINNSGQIVGMFLAHDQTWHAFQRSAAGTYTTIEAAGATHSEVWAINNRGQAVGSFGGYQQLNIHNADGTFAAFSVPGVNPQPGTDLQRIQVGAESVQIGDMALYGINDTGQVCGELGYSTNLIQNNVFIATPMSPGGGPRIRSYFGVTVASAFGGSVTIAPGTWVEIYGEGFTDHSRQWQASDFVGVAAPVSLDGVSVDFNGLAGYVSYISPEQVNAFVPFSLPTGQTAVSVKSGLATSSQQMVTVSALQPGLLTEALQYGPYVIATFPDGVTYALPPGNLPGVPARRPKPGDTIILFGTGFGPMSPSNPEGQLTAQLSHLQTPLEVSFYSKDPAQAVVPATVTYAGLAPGYLGLYQLNVVVPNVLPNDSMQVSINLNGVTTVQALQIAIGQ